MKPNIEEQLEKLSKEERRELYRMKILRGKDRPMPELVPGSVIGTVFEEDPDVAELKREPTSHKWYAFLKRIGWQQAGDRLATIPSQEWPMVYALAKTFSGMTIAHDLKVTKDMFEEKSFLCFPEAMKHILEEGTLDCDISWSQTDYLNLWATLDYHEHYPKKKSKGMKLFYWDGQLDRNGILRGKLQLHQSDELTY